MNLILLGAPGAGKGSITSVLLKKYPFYHLSTGDVLRQMAKSNSPLGQKVAHILKQGQLVSDDLVNEIVSNILKNLDSVKYSAGVIFDGYPRTLQQAQYLATITHIDQAILLDVNDDLILQRVQSRRVCPICHKTYSTIYKELQPKEASLCDDCHVTLITRKDDDLNVVKNRLVIYHKESAPLIHYYQQKNLLTVLNGNWSLAQWTHQIEKFMQQ